MILFKNWSDYLVVIFFIALINLPLAESFIQEEYPESFDQVTIQPIRYEIIDDHIHEENKTTTPVITMKPTISGTANALEVNVSDFIITKDVGTVNLT